ncbi:AMP-binding protein [Paenibacillus sp. GSMTC-2017]|uniref:AMP-binding protein n=1 Tax=Paenibacillus sp. GSMTC-2017 TaxID=2794350 RepID=UPI0018D69AB6|nr:AMP-binding protein [Paenibacillus sp. GSMTC-2017]MBH5319903.1 AMP-binding protein [Paenibacillus sp. GSMTC-2017]
MFKVNNRAIPSSDFQSMMDSYAQLVAFQTTVHRCYAICSSDAVLVISLVHFIRQRGDSVLLLFGETPIDTAKRLAEKAGCVGLFYGVIEQYVPLDEVETKDVRLPSLYQFSSGTTGEPKLIGRSWDELARETKHYNELLSRYSLGEATPIILASITHSYGLITGVFSAMERGIRPVIISGQNPKSILQSIIRIPNHIIYAVPSLLAGLAPLFEYSAIQLNAVISSGAPMSSGLFEEYRAKTKRMIQQYGCTEAGCVSLAVDMESYDDLGETLGHISVLADSDPAELRIQIIGGVQLATGDLGHRAVSGRLRFLGRIDDLINVAGLKVMPLEVEEVICKLAGVSEAVVYRGSHPLAGDIVRAQVRADANASITAEQVREWCMRELPTYKVPTDVQIVTSIQKMPSGKISRKLLEQGEV